MMIEHKTQTVEEREPTKEKIGQMDTSAPIAQIQGAPPQIIVVDKEKLEEDKDNPKEKVQEAIQTLLNLPTTRTPTRILYKPSTDTMPLQIFAPGSSSAKVARVLHYGDPTLDEEIVIPKYDYATITLEKINIM